MNAVLLIDIVYTYESGWHMFTQTNFTLSSAADIRCQAVRPSVSLNSNRIDAFSFHPIFPMFGVNVHSNIAQEVVQVEFWFFGSIFFNGSLIIMLRVRCVWNKHQPRVTVKNALIV